MNFFLACVRQIASIFPVLVLEEYGCEGGVRANTRVCVIPGRWRAT